MKVYKFYKKLTDAQLEGSANLSMSDKYPLYAFTNNKKYRKIFKEMRGDKFIEIVDKLDKEDYNRFMNNNRNCLLEELSYDTLYERRGCHVVISSCTVLSTMHERDIVEDIEQGLFDIWNPGILFNPYVFNDKYLKILNKLEYVSSWKTMGNITDIEKEICNIDLDSFDYPSYTADQFAIFVQNFEDTFNDFCFRKQNNKIKKE